MVNFFKDILWSILDRIFHEAESIVPSTIDLQDIRSVLVIRPDRLGDVILSTPIYESIKRSNPATRISVLANRNQEEILRDNPFIDRLVTFRHRHPWQVYRDLNQEGYDLAIVPNQVFSATAAVLALFSRAKLRMGYENKRGAWVFHIRAPQPSEAKHETQHNLDLLRFLGYTTLSNAPSVYFNNDVAQKVGELLYEKNRHPDRPLVLVKPGTRVPQWGWSPKKFRAVSNHLLENSLAEVFIICGPGEEKPVASLVADMVNQPVILPVLNGRELAYLIKRADLLFCSHTGIMHLASAVKTPVVTVFKHGDSTRWGPCQTRNVILNEREGQRLSTDDTLHAIRELLPVISSRPLRNFS